MLATKNSEQLDNSYPTVIVGLGVSGLSCARYLAAQQERFCVVDTREQPAALGVLRQEMPDVDVLLGGWHEEVLLRAKRLIVSPGISVHEAALQQAADESVEIIGDVELFARQANAPIVAITGSNGKSTVTTLLGEMAKQAGVNVQVGGNLGTPVLDLLKPTAELYVLELSSFQLETTHSLQPAAAVVLNISPDHLDRYPSMTEYMAAKQEIYRHAKYALVNRDDAKVLAMAADADNVHGFSLMAPQNDDFGVLQKDGKTFLAKGDQLLLDAAELKLKGRHNIANVLAAFALGEAVGLPLAVMKQAAKEFAGLPHRMQSIAMINQVEWINDSKGTNVGASVAAVNGIDSPLVLIAGGIAKETDFSALGTALQHKARAVVLFGRDAAVIQKDLPASLKILHASDLQDAVTQAAAQAQSGDVVLFSPACASFDMFDNYVARGEAFVAAVTGGAQHGR